MTCNETIKYLLGDGKIEPAHIKFSSPKVSPGDVFFAIRGSKADGHDFAEEAIQRGARCIVAEKIPPELKGREDIFILCDDTRKALGLAASKVFGEPSQSMSTFGVTGTNGKTTTVALIRHILERSGAACGMVGTVETNSSPGVFMPSDITTPDPVEFNRLLASMRDSGMQAAAVEISSHALSQDRIFGTALDAAIFTNISSEHMDYHLTMERYLSDKWRIFGLRKPGGIAFVNIDDDIIRAHLKHTGLKGVLTYGFSEDADIRALNVKCGSGGSVFDVSLGDNPIISTEIPLLGEFNVLNALVSIAAVYHVGKVPLEQACSFVRDAIPPRGRLEKVSAKAPFTVLVDYAHTPGALEKVLSSVRALTAGRLICVIGCGGDRDSSKRPLMGDIASSLADIAIFTSDNPRGEEPGSIIEQMLSGVREGTVECEVSRRGAIELALRSAAKGDTVIIAGKGHETYQESKGRRNDFNDKVVAEQILASAPILSKGVVT